MMSKTTRVSVIFELFILQNYKTKLTAFFNIVDKVLTIILYILIN